MSVEVLLCWECKEPIPDGGLQVFRDPKSQWSQSLTRICASCFDKRETEPVSS